MEVAVALKSPESMVLKSLKKYSPDQLIESEITSLKEIQIHIANMFVEVDQQTAVEAKKNIFLLKALGEIDLLKIYIVLLKYFSHSIKVSEKMSTMDMLEIAKEYIKAYPYNSVKDFILLLKNIRLAKYGPIFNRLDIAVFFEFMKKYEENKSEFLEKKHKYYNGSEMSEQNIFLHCPQHILEKCEKAVDENFSDPNQIKSEIRRMKQLKKLFNEEN